MMEPDAMDFSGAFDSASHAIERALETRFNDEANIDRALLRQSEYVSDQKVIGYIRSSHFSAGCEDGLINIVRGYASTPTFLSNLNSRRGKGPLATTNMFDMERAVIGLQMMFIELKLDCMPSDVQDPRFNIAVDMIIEHVGFILTRTIGEYTERDNQALTRVESQHTARLDTPTYPQIQQKTGIWRK